jgi:hypothetical protein
LTALKVFCFYVFTRLFYFGTTESDNGLLSSSSEDHSLY